MSTTPIAAPQTYNELPNVGAEHPAGGDLDAEQHHSREEHHDGDRQTCERARGAPSLKVVRSHAPRAAGAGGRDGMRGLGRRER